MNTDEVEAQMLLSNYNSTAEVVWNAYTEAAWKYNTDINEANKKAMVRSTPQRSPPNHSAVTLQQSNHPC